MRNMKKKIMTQFLVLITVLALTGCGSDEEAALENEIIWTNSNINAVQNNPENETIIVLDQDYFVTAIMDYHYFNDGEKPGKISLVGEDGEKYGPWQAKGREGQGGVENAYWDVFPDIQLKAGEYKVIDSDVETWSQNEDSGNAGITEVRGYEVN